MVLRFLARLHADNKVPTRSAPSALSAPLTAGALSVARVPMGGRFNATTFTAGETAYAVSANAGVPTTSTRLLY